MGNLLDRKGLSIILLKIEKGCSIVTRTFLSSLLTLPFGKPGPARTQETFAKAVLSVTKTIVIDNARADSSMLYF